MFLKTAFATTLQTVSLFYTFKSKAASQSRVDGLGQLCWRGHCKNP